MRFWTLRGQSTTTPSRCRAVPRRPNWRRSRNRRKGCENSMEIFPRTTNPSRTSLCGWIPDIQTHSHARTQPDTPPLARHAQVPSLPPIHPRAQANLEKVDDLLDRCRITAKRCKQLVYRYRDRYAPRENDLCKCLFALGK